MRLRTTPLGAQRVRRNIGLASETDVVAWCCNILNDKKFHEIIHSGKNFYIICPDFTITINASAHTIITAHRH